MEWSPAISFASVSCDDRRRRLAPVEQPIEAYLLVGRGRRDGQIDAAGIAADPGPGAGAFDADHPLVPLVLAADLTAPEAAVRVMGEGGETRRSIETEVHAVDVLENAVV